MSEDRQISPLEKKGWLEKVTDLFSGEPKDKNDLIEVVKEAAASEIINPTTFDIIEGALEISELQVRDIMVPRSHIQSVSETLSLQEVLELMVDCAHSRLPVFSEDNERIVGVLLAKDMLSLAVNCYFNVTKMEEQWRSLIREPVIVPESKRLNTMLKDFRNNRNHMAVVVDEYGSIAGIVTIEDVLEEIVGEIEDEFDDDIEDNFIKNEDGSYTVQALTEIEDFNDRFGAKLSDEEFDTLGGLVTHSFGHLPKRGESVILADFECVIEKSDNRRIKTLRVKPLY